MKAALAILAVTAGVAHAQPQPTPATVLANVEATYKKPQHFGATFTQTVTYAINDKTTKSTGNVYLSKPDKLRFDYIKNSKPEKHFIFDGTTLWDVEHEKLEVVKLKASGSDLPAAMRFFTGAGTLAADFNIAHATAKKQLVPGAIVLVLTPKKPSAQYKELYFVVDPAKWLVTRTTVINSSGDVNTFEFANITNTDIPAKRYQFDPKSVPHYKLKIP